MAAVQKFDYKTIGIAALLSSGLGVGGGMIGTDDTEILQEEIRRESLDDEEANRMTIEGMRRYDDPLKIGLKNDTSAGLILVKKWKNAAFN